MKMRSMMSCLKSMATPSEAVNAISQQRGRSGSERHRSTSPREQSRERSALSKMLIPSLTLLAVAGCTTTGTGIGYSANNAVQMAFNWKADSSRHGMMTASLNGRETYEGPFFQITRETTVDELRPLWTGWGYRGRWHGWGYWGPEQQTITQYSGRVLANLSGPMGHIRCHFNLMSPSSGMSGGGQGRCQLPDGTQINAEFAPHH